MRYEQDLAPDPVNADVINANRREASERIVYHDDLEGGVEHYADTDRSEFDGLGNWRRVRTNGNFGSADISDSYVGYDASTGNYPSAGCRMPATTDAWVLKTYNIWKRQEGQSAGVNDVLIVNNWNGAGQLVREQYYGGDVQNIGTASLCSMQLPTSDQYQVRHSYQFGVRNYSQYYDERNAALGPRIVDITVDRNTGLARTRRDSAWLATSYEYDWKGRETLIKPPAGHGAQTQYRYFIATGAQWGGERIVLNHLPNAGGNVLTEFITTLDSFGQPWAEQQYMPDGTYSSRFKNYNAQGWVTQESEFSNAEPKYTSYLNYDPFGRPRLVRPPDGQQHDTTYEYAGVRSVKKTVKAAISYNASTGAVNEGDKASTTVYDRQGRLWKSIRHGIDKFGQTQDVVTVNFYNVAGDLLQVQRGGSPASFVSSYDGRGFTTSEYDSFRNQTVTYTNIDARGNARRTQRTYHWNVITSSYDSLYDRAGRLTRVQETSDPSKVLKEFEYAPANGTNDWRAGKLWKTKRYNDMSRFLGVHGVNTVVVSELYTYGGIGGRISQYDVELSDTFPRSEKFYQTYSYTEMGNVREVGYPSSAADSGANIGRTRKVANTYQAGMLTSVAGTLGSQAESWVNSISYHSNGLVSRVAHSNGVTDIITTDPNGFTRVASVSTTGAKEAITNRPADLNTGEFQYDGDGALVRTGSQYFISAESTDQLQTPTSTGYSSPCDAGWADSLGMVYAFGDRNCDARVFYYYTASDRLFKEENALPGHERKVWYLWDTAGNLLTEYATHHAHYQPYSNSWKSTVDYIYSGDALAAKEERRPDLPQPRIQHNHPGYGATGMWTDGNGYRVTP